MLGQQTVESAQPVQGRTTSDVHSAPAIRRDLHDPRIAGRFRAGPGCLRRGRTPTRSERSRNDDRRPGEEPWPPERDQLLEVSRREVTVPTPGGGRGGT